MKALVLLTFLILGTWGTEDDVPRKFTNGHGGYQFYHAEKQRQEKFFEKKHYHKTTTELDVDNDIAENVNKYETRDTEKVEATAEVAKVRSSRNRSSEIANKTNKVLGGVTSRVRRIRLPRKRTGLRNSTKSDVKSENEGWVVTIKNTVNTKNKEVDREVIQEEKQHGDEERHSKEIGNLKPANANVSKEDLNLAESRSSRHEGFNGVQSNRRSGIVKMFTEEIPSRVVAGKFEGGNQKRKDEDYDDNSEEKMMQDEAPMQERSEENGKEVNNDEPLQQSSDTNNSVEVSSGHNLTHRESNEKVETKPDFKSKELDDQMLEETINYRTQNQRSSGQSTRGNQMNNSVRTSQSSNEEIREKHQGLQAEIKPKVIEMKEDGVTKTVIQKNSVHDKHQRVQAGIKSEIVEDEVNKTAIQKNSVPIIEREGGEIKEGKSSNEGNKSTSQQNKENQSIITGEIEESKSALTTTTAERNNEENQTNQTGSKHSSAEEVREAKSTIQRGRLRNRTVARERQVNVSNRRKNVKNPNHQRQLRRRNPNLVATVNSEVNTTTPQTVSEEHAGNDSKTVNVTQHPRGSPKPRTASNADNNKRLQNGDTDAISNRRRYAQFVRRSWQNQNPRRKSVRRVSHSETENSVQVKRSYATQTEFKEQEKTTSAHIDNNPKVENEGKNTVIDEPIIYQSNETEKKIYNPYKILEKLNTPHSDQSHSASEKHPRTFNFPKRIRLKFTGPEIETTSNKMIDVKSRTTRNPQESNFRTTSGRPIEINPHHLHLDHAPKTTSGRPVNINPHHLYEDEVELDSNNNKRLTRTLTVYSRDIFKLNSSFKSDGKTVDENNTNGKEETIKTRFDEDKTNVGVDGNEETLKKSFHGENTNASVDGKEQTLKTSFDRSNTNAEVDGKGASFDEDNTNTEVDRQEETLKRSFDEDKTNAGVDGKEETLKKSFHKDNTNAGVDGMEANFDEDNTNTTIDRKEEIFKTSLDENNTNASVVGKEETSPPIEEINNLENNTINKRGKNLTQKEITLQNQTNLFARRISNGRILTVYTRTTQAPSNEDDQKIIQKTRQENKFGTYRRSYGLHRKSSLQQNDQTHTSSNIQNAYQQHNNVNRKLLISKPSDPPNPVMGIRRMLYVPKYNRNILKTKIQNETTTLRMGNVVDAENNDDQVGQSTNAEIKLQSNQSNIQTEKIENYKSILIIDGDRVEETTKNILFINTDPSRNNHTQYFWMNQNKEIFKKLGITTNDENIGVINVRSTKDLPKSLYENSVRNQNFILKMRRMAMGTDNATTTVSPLNSVKLKRELYTRRPLQKRATMASSTRAPYYERFFNVTRILRQASTRMTTPRAVKNTLFGQLKATPRNELPFLQKFRRHT